METKESANGTRISPRGQWNSFKSSAIYVMRPLDVGYGFLYPAQIICYKNKYLLHKNIS